MAARPPTGFALGLGANERGGSLMFRARIVRVIREKIDQDSVAMLFDVVPDNATVMSSGDNIGTSTITNVAMLQAGFGSLTEETTSPTGIVYIPEEGSRVLVAHDGVQYVIVGFYTGPSKTSETTDAAGIQSSMNPGLEKAATKVNSSVTSFSPDWLYGAKPGDVILGKGISRVKVTSEVALIGTGPNCMTIYKSDWSKLERCKELDSRMIGYQKSHKVHFGNETQGLLHTARPKAVPAPTGAAITTEVFESTPYAQAKKAMFIAQRGHITEKFKANVRQAILGEQSLLDISAEETAGVFTAARDFVAKPLPTARPGLVPRDELNVDHYETFDRQTDSDGSWFIKAGNSARLIGPVSKASSKLDMDMSYDAQTGDFRLALGKSGSFIASMTLNGATGEIAVTGNKVTTDAKLQARVICGQSSLLMTQTDVVIDTKNLKIKANSMVVDAPRSEFKGRVNATTDVTVGQISLKTHKHPFAVVGDASAVTPTQPPV